MRIEIVGTPFRVRMKTYTVYFAVFKCFCGNNFVYNAGHVRAGRCNGCGCTKSSNKTTHGMTNTPEWYSWSAMRTRCLNPNVVDYSRYGGRGITFCESWSDFSAFFADMGYRPEGTTLDRIDVNGNYCKENCRWATSKQQGRNRRNSTLLTHKGQTKCISEWAEYLDVSVNTLIARIREGWSISDALETPIDFTRRNTLAKKEAEGRKPL